MSQLVGKRCRLRPLRLDDSNESVKWRNDPETRRNAMGFRFPVTEAMEKAWFDRALAGQDPQRVTFAIEDHAATLVGFVHLTDIDWVSRSAEFGISIGSKVHRGVGLGTEATTLMLDYAFDQLNLKRVGLRYIADNKAAAQTYDRLGFTVEGRLRAATFEEGKYHDIVVCGLLRSEWNSLPSRAASSSGES
jgi:RimJ/RimL family protein N-acetyltransferase